MSSNPEMSDISDMDMGQGEVDQAVELPPAPVFTPQPPPKGLGAVRTLILILMGMVGVLELVLFLGLWLARSLPADTTPSQSVSQTTSANTVDGI